MWVEGAWTWALVPPRPLLRCLWPSGYVNVCMCVCPYLTYIYAVGGTREFSLFSIPCAQLIVQKGCNKVTRNLSKAEMERAALIQGITEGQFVYHVTAYAPVEQTASLTWCSPSFLLYICICMYVHMYVCIYISPSPVVANVVAVLLVGAGYFNNVLWFWQHLNSAFV